MLLYYSYFLGLAQRLRSWHFRCQAQGQTSQGLESRDEVIAWEDRGHGLGPRQAGEGKGSLETRAI